MGLYNNIFFDVKKLYYIKIYFVYKNFRNFKN